MLVSPKSGTPWCCWSCEMGASRNEDKQHRDRVKDIAGWEFL